MKAKVGEEGTLATKASTDYKNGIVEQVRHMDSLRTPPELTRPLNYLEQEELQILFALGENMDTAREVLAKRCAHIKNSKQRISIAQWACRSLFLDVLKQLPVPLQDRFIAQSRVMRAEVRPSGVSQVKRSNDQTICFCDDLYTLTETVYKSHCIMCNKTGKDAKKCKVKKALDNMQILTPVDNADCWYKLI